MSGNRSSGNLLWWLWMTKRIKRKAQDRPQTTVQLLSRLLFVWIGVGIFHKILWNTLVAMPTGLWVFVGGVLTIRLTRWYLRRHR